LPRLLDTSALIVFLRRSPPPAFAAVAEATADGIRGHRAVVPAVAVTELLTGARDHRAEYRVLALLERLPVVAAGREVASLAGRMGREARASGGPLPSPDLLIAATARWLELPLLTCDSDFSRCRALAAAAQADSPWHGFTLHAASVAG